MYIECKQKILFQMDIENNSKISTPKIKIKKGYPCEITMRTLVHTLAHRSHSVSKLNLSFVRLAQCSHSPRHFRAADRTQDPQYMEVPDVVGQRIAVSRAKRARLAAFS